MWPYIVILILKYLLTAIGLTPGGSSSVHIYTQTIHRTIQITTNLEECGPCPVFASFALAFALQLRKKHGKTSFRVRKNLSQNTVYILPKHPHIYFYSRTNMMHNFSSLLNITLHVSVGLSVYRQESKTVRKASGICHTGFRGCLLARTRCNTSSISFPLASSPLNCMTYTWRCMYSLGLLMMDEKTDRNM
jgi:hypothetical protein